MQQKNGVWPSFFNQITEGPPLGFEKKKSSKEEEDQEIILTALSEVLRFLRSHLWSNFDITRSVTPWNFANCKSMFSVFPMLFDWFGWVEVLCKLAMCDFLDVDVELCGVLLT